VVEAIAERREEPSVGMIFFHLSSPGESVKAALGTNPSPVPLSRSAVPGGIVSRKSFTAASADHGAAAEI
jgi:hypothetical protein